MARMKFMNTEIDNLTMQETLQAIDQLIQENKSAYVVTPNVDHIVQLETNKELQAVYKNASLILTDGNQKPDRKPEFESEQQKAVYWIKYFLEKGDMSANEIYCRLDNEGVSKRVARMVKTEMGIHCYQKKRKWYWSVQPEEGVMNGPQV